MAQSSGKRQTSPVPTAFSQIQQARLDLLARTQLQMAGFKPRDLRRAYQRVLDGLDANEEKAVFDKLTSAVTKVLLADHRTRLMAADKLFKLTGAYPSEREQGPGGTSTIVEVTLLSAGGERTTVRVGTKVDP